MTALAEYAARSGASGDRNQCAGPTGDAFDVLTALGVHYPSVTDPNAALLTALRSPPILPVTYVLRPDGSVSRVNPPVVFRTADEVASAVARHGAPFG